MEAGEAGANDHNIDGFGLKRIYHEILSRIVQKRRA